MNPHLGTLRIEIAEKEVMLRTETAEARLNQHESRELLEVLKRIAAEHEPFVVDKDDDSTSLSTSKFEIRSREGRIELNLIVPRAAGGKTVYELRLDRSILPSMIATLEGALK